MEKDSKGNQKNCFTSFQKTSEIRETAQTKTIYGANGKTLIDGKLITRSWRESIFSIY